MSDMMTAMRAAMGRLAGKNINDDPDQLADVAGLKPDDSGFYRAADGTQVMHDPKAIKAYMSYAADLKPGIEVVDPNKDAVDDGWPGKQYEDRDQSMPLDQLRTKRQPGEPAVQVWTGTPVIESRTADQDKKYADWLKSNADMLKYHESKKGQ